VSLNSHQERCRDPLAQARPGFSLGGVLGKADDDNVAVSGECFGNLVMFRCILADHVVGVDDPGTKMVTSCPPALLAGSDDTHAQRPGGSHAGTSTR
jgi:hypothetical protein